jgi:hypothetical protein
MGPQHADCFADIIAEDSTRQGDMGAPIPSSELARGIGFTRQRDLLLQV